MRMSSSAGRAAAAQATLAGREHFEGLRRGLAFLACLGFALFALAVAAARTGASTPSPRPHLSSAVSASCRPSQAQCFAMAASDWGDFVYR